MTESFDLFEPLCKPHAQRCCRVPGNGKSAAMLGPVCGEGCDDEVSTRSNCSGDTVRILSLVVRIDEEMKGGAVVPNVDLIIEPQIEHICAHKSDYTVGVSKPFAELIERTT